MYKEDIWALVFLILPIKNLKVINFLELCLSYCRPPLTCPDQNKRNYRHQIIQEYTSVIVYLYKEDISNLGLPYSSNQKFNSDNFSDLCFSHCQSSLTGSNQKEHNYKCQKNQEYMLVLCFCIRQMFQTWVFLILMNKI